MWSSYLNLWCLLCLGDVVVHMDIVSKLDADFDDVEAHLDDMLASHAVVPRPHIAFESILQHHIGHISISPLLC